MTSIDDLALAERRVDEILNEMQEADGDEVQYDVLLHTKAVCYAILAVGVRFQYVAEKIYNRTTELPRF